MIIPPGGRMTSFWVILCMLPTVCKSFCEKHQTGMHSSVPMWGCVGPRRAPVCSHSHCKSTDPHPADTLSGQLAFPDSCPSWGSSSALRCLPSSFLTCFMDHCSHVFAHPQAFKADRECDTISFTMERVQGRNGTSSYPQQQSQTTQKTWMKRNILTASSFSSQNLKDSKEEGKHRDLLLTQHFPWRTHQVMIGVAAPPLTWGHCDTADQCLMDLCTLPLETVSLFPWVSVPETIWNFLHSVDNSSNLQSVFSVFLPMQHTNNK